MDAPPMVGYAATARLRSGEPPIVGGSFHDRSDFWNSILEIPAPRILVLEDMDEPPGRGAFVGDMHAAILKALGCVGYLTNGAVRELPAVRTTGIALFAGSVAVSHAYAHIFDLGATVTVGGMEVRPGKFVARRPARGTDGSAEFATKIPEAAAELATNRAKSNRFLPIKRVLSSQTARDHENNKLGMTTKDGHQICLHPKLLAGNARESWQENSMDEGNDRSRRIPTLGIGLSKPVALAGLAL